MNIRDAVMIIPGVGQATILGGQDYSMRIWLDPNKLFSLKISVSDVIAAINEQNIQVTAGQIGSEPASKKPTVSIYGFNKGKIIKSRRI